jgi:erythromycin esterase
MKIIAILFLFITGCNIGHAQTNNTDATAWLNKNNIPIKTVKAESGLEDLKPLNTIIGDARIVELGECTHGSSEIFSMKHRMLEYLVKEKGFTIFSIEANMPEAYALNQYILEGKGDSRKLLAGMYFWTWYTQEVLDMIEWMKKYNETATNKISFTGFDMQIAVTSIKIVRDYVSENQPSLLPAINKFDSTNRHLEKVGKKLKKGDAKDLGALASEMISTLQETKSLTRDKPFEWALQNARILLQYSQYLNKGPNRDECMAANVKWILEQNPDAKMVIWAHNGHILKVSDKFGQVKMGGHLSKLYGKQMLTIGFTSEEGTYTAYSRTHSSIDSANILISGRKNSCESIFKTADADNYIIDLRNSAITDKATSWMFEKPLMRTIGALVDDKYQFIDTDLNKEYDMIIFLKKTSSSKCFSITTKKE